MPRIAEKKRLPRTYSIQFQNQWPIGPEIIEQVCMCYCDILRKTEYQINVVLLIFLNMLLHSPSDTTVVLDPVDGSKLSSCDNMFLLNQ